MKADQPLSQIMDFCLGPGEQPGWTIDPVSNNDLVDVVIGRLQRVEDGESKELAHLTLQLIELIGDRLDAVLNLLDSFQLLIERVFDAVQLLSRGVRCYVIGID